MGVATNAAMATLCVSKKQYESDKLLQWVCHLASPFQLTVQTENSKAPLLQLETQGTTLTMRNAILRTICGMGLHNALDQAPYYLMGGGSLGRPAAVGQLMQYMSLADSLRTKATSADDVLPELEELLEQKSFLIGSAQASLADFDLALVLAAAAAPEESSPVDATVYPHVARWRDAVLWTFAATAPPEIAAPTAAAPAMPDEPLVFFYGTEDVGSVLQPKPAKAAPKAADDNDDKPKPEQQQQGKKKGKDGEQAAANQGKKAKGGGGGGGGQPAAADGYTIAAMDIRVGKIVKAWHHENSGKLFCEEVDIGDDAPRKIASGLRQFYETQDLQDRLVLVICNLKARPLGGFPSHGMVLCASNADHTAVEFVVPPEGAKPGDRIVFEGFEGEPEPENKVNKKKIFEKVAPDFKTDGDGNVVWKTALAKVENGGGIVKAVNGMANASVS